MTYYGQGISDPDGKNVLNVEAPKLDLVKMVQAAGVEHIAVVDTWERRKILQAMRKALKHPGPSVVIAHGPCQQLPEMKSREITPFFVVEEDCTKCEACFKVWCPAITRTDEDFPVIDASDCTSCTVCAQMCPTDAIVLMNSVVAV